VEKVEVQYCHSVAKVLKELAYGGTPMAATPEGHARIERLLEHQRQVDAGLIPADSPPDFLRPEGADALDERGLPWWMGPEYLPTPEALAEFSRPPRAVPDDENPGQAAFDL
jgi:hypothetical protein